jgi:regulator of nonsense transcripts 1
VPILFLDSSGEESRLGSSFQNWEEGEITERVIRTLVRGGITDSQIGIVTPYRGQVALLEERIHEGGRWPKLKIATADSFQGSECDYIVMSCVRNGNKIGFVDDRRRMNVSLTRARLGLIIVGNRATLAGRSTDWAQLCTYFERNNAMRKEGGETVRENVKALLHRTCNITVEG